VIVITLLPPPFTFMTFDIPSCINITVYESLPFKSILTLSLTSLRKLITLPVIRVVICVSGSLPSSVPLICVLVAWAS